MQQSPLVLAAGRVAHLDLDDAVALGERQSSDEDRSRDDVVPARADPDRDGQRQAARDRQARILHEHPDTQLVILHACSFLPFVSNRVARARTSAAAMSTVSIAVSSARDQPAVTPQAVPMRFLEIAEHVLGLSGRRQRIAAAPSPTAGSPSSASLR